MKIKEWLCGLQTQIKMIKCGKISDDLTFF